MIGKYSRLRFCANSCFSASLTDGKTNGFPSAPRYAPTPTESLRSSESAANRELRPRMASGGPSSTLAQGELRKTGGEGMVGKVNRCVGERKG